MEGSEGGRAESEEQKRKEKRGKEKSEESLQNHADVAEEEEAVDEPEFQMGMTWNE